MIAASQISSIVLVHRHLYQTQRTNDVDLSDYLGELIDEMSAVIDGPCHLKVNWTSNCRGLFVSSAIAMRLGLIVTELLTNCAKHSGNGRLCSIALSSRSELFELRITDDGPGLPADFQESRWKSTGMRLVESLCSSLGGVFAAPRSESGACFVVSVPRQCSARTEGAASSSGEDAENHACTANGACLGLQAEAAHDSPDAATDIDLLLLTAIDRQK
jgi:two-component sensor histidine kinase